MLHVFSTNLVKVMIGKQKTTNKAATQTKLSGIEASFETHDFSSVLASSYKKQTNSSEISIIIFI